MDTNLDPNSNSVQVPGGPFPVETTGPTTSTTTTQQVGYSSTSTISSSDLEASMAMYLANSPQFPQTVSAPGVSNVAGISVDLTSSYNRIMDGMLDSWQRSIDENGQRIREQYIQKVQVQDPMMQEWVASAQLTLQLVHQNNLQFSLDRQDALRVGSSESTNNANKSTPVNDNDGLPIFAMGSVAGIGAAGATSITAMVSVSDGPSLSHMEQIVVAIVPDDMRAQLGLIGALMAAPLFIYTANAATAATTTADTPDKVRDLNSARNWARSLIATLRGNAFDNFVTVNVLNRMAGGRDISPERRQQLLSIAKIILLSSAMMAIYKLETGKITGQEWFAMLNGQMTLPEGDIRNQLVAQIHSYLADLDPPEATRLLTALAGFADTDPSAADVVEPGRVFAGILADVSANVPVKA